MKMNCGKGRENKILIRAGRCLALMLTASLTVNALLIFTHLGMAENGCIDTLADIYWKQGEIIEITSQDFVVEADQTLYIEPGVIVYIQENRGIDVKGRLVALGTKEEPITFTKMPGSSYPGPWRSLRFIGAQESILQHVTISMAKNGVQITSSSPIIRESTIIGTRSAVVVDSRNGPPSNPLFVNSSIFSGMAYFDFDISGESWVTALNTTYDDIKTKIGDPTAHIERQWYLDILVRNSLGELLGNANVTLEDNANGTSKQERMTDSNGRAQFVATEYVSNFGFFGKNRTYYTPHTFFARKIGYDTSERRTVKVESNTIGNITMYDNEAPTTILILSTPRFGEDPAYIGPETELSFQVGPGGTEPIETYYSLDGGVLKQYTGDAFTIQSEGVHMVSYFSRDPAGNVEGTRRKQVFVDTTPPSIQAVLNPSGDGSHPNVIESTTTLSLIYSDHGSGISAVEYAIGGGDFLPYTGPMTFSYPFSYNVSYRAWDNIGNFAGGETWFIIISPSKPNSPPEFITKPIEKATIGKEYSYLAQAIDMDNDTLTYSLLTYPLGMEIDPVSGVLTWKPTEEQEGQNLVFLAVSDGEDTDIQVFYIRAEHAARSEGAGLILWSVVSLVLVLMGSFAFGTEYGRFRFLLFILPLYSKLKRDRVLSQFLRGQIYGYITAYPGENYSSIKKALNIENGTLTHHLHILEREGFITSRIDGRYKRFYPSGVAIKERMNLSMIQKAILKLIRQNTTITQIEIAEALGTSKQVVNYHIKALVNAGLLSVTKKGSRISYKDKASDRET